VDKSKSTSRYPRLSEVVILTQTDTTVGFLSQNKDHLDAIKGRPPHKPYLVNFFDFFTCKEFIRIPKSRKKEVRRAKKTTFIVKDQAFRVAQPQTSSVVLQKLRWCYSTSANKSGSTYDPAFAKKHTDIIIENAYGLYKDTPSKLIKISSKRKIRLR